MFYGPGPYSTRSIIDGEVVDSLERRIEEGKVFEGTIDFSTANNGGTSEALFRTASKAVKVIQRLISTNGNELTYQAFSGPTIGGGGPGSDVTNAVNRNGNSSIATTVTLYDSPDITADGTAIPPVYIPGTEPNGQRTVQAFSAVGSIRELLPNTDYLVRLTNDGDVMTAKTQIYLLYFEYDPATVSWRP